MLVVAHFARVMVATMLAAAAPPLHAQAWKPERPVEIMVGCAPGCGPDIMARLMQRVFQTRRYFEQPVTVLNKSGGGGTVARAHIKPFEGNGHYLYHSDKGALAGHAMGRYDYNDLTPVAILFGEYIGIAVKANSPIKSGHDLIERLKNDPAAASLGIATSLGNVNHQGVASALRNAGIDVRKTRNVVFQSGADAISAMLGGHIDVVPVSLGLWVDHLKAGTVRVIAVSAPERLPGHFAQIPTWREQGTNVTVFNWRAIYGPKHMTPPQIAFWETQFERLVATLEWKADMAMRNGVTQFTRSAAFKKVMDDEYPEVHALLKELGLAKR
ncbi:MAG: tripartite tricarboxylate transporter substrate binding protein [Betaproteobacteria bacterium]|nr:tripartite tricarboxylate transporter substrate binding protein [Betaproteobacteria bacterium]